jgi:hypothetical protein
VRISERVSIPVDAVPKREVVRYVFDSNRRSSNRG